MLSDEARRQKWAKDWQSLPAAQRDAISSSLPEELREELDAFCAEVREAEFKTNDQQFHIYSGWLAALVEDVAKEQRSSQNSQSELPASAAAALLAGHELLISKSSYETEQSHIGRLSHQLRDWFRRL